MNPLFRPSSTRIVTLDDIQERDKNSLFLRLKTRFFTEQGGGHSIASHVPSGPALVSPEREAQIRERLRLRIQQADDRNLIGIVEGLRSNGLFLGLLDHWLSQMQAILPGSPDFVPARARLLGDILTLLIIYADEESHWEVTARKMLQKWLSQGQSIEAFLLECGLAQDEPIRQKLEVRLASRCEKKVFALVEKIRSSGLLTGMEQKIEEWSDQFFELAPERREDRGLLLGILVFSLIRPALMQSANLEERRQLALWEKECRDLLPQLLPFGELVEKFLFDCDIAIREERIFRLSLERIQEAVRIYLDVLRLKGEKTLGQIDQKCTSLRQRMVAFEESRAKQAEEVAGQISEAETAVEQLRQRLIAERGGMNELSDQKEAYQSQTDATVDQCEALLARFL